MSLLYNSDLFKMVLNMWYLFGWIVLCESGAQRHQPILKQLCREIKDKSNFMYIVTVMQNAFSET